MCEKASLVKSAQGAEAGAAAAKAVADNEVAMEQREKPIKHEGNVTVTTKPRKNEKFLYTFGAAQNDEDKELTWSRNGTNAEKNRLNGAEMAQTRVGME